MIFLIMEIIHKACFHTLDCEWYCNGEKYYKKICRIVTNFFYEKKNVLKDKPFWLYQTLF